MSGISFEHRSSEQSERRPTFVTIATAQKSFSISVQSRTLVKKSDKNWWNLYDSAWAAHQRKRKRGYNNSFLERCGIIYDRLNPWSPPVDKVSLQIGQPKISKFSEDVWVFVSEPDSTAVNWHPSKWFDNQSHSICLNRREFLPKSLCWQSTSRSFHSSSRHCRRRKTRLFGERRLCFVFKVLEPMKTMTGLCLRILALSSSLLNFSFGLPHTQIWISFLNVISYSWLFLSAIRTHFFGSLP